MPTITPADLTPLIYDPAQVQDMVLRNMGKYQINEPTNPCVMLLEAASTLAAASALESTAGLKRLYPSLATDMSEVITHVNSKELMNIFSTPAETSIVFYLNVRELINLGYRANNSPYVETIIPLGTVVTITKIPFTLLNDIHVKLYDSGVVFAEQLTSIEAAANNSIGVLPTGIVNFQDGESWVAVETTIKQVYKNTITKAITAAEGFVLDVKHTDRYYYTEAYYKNADTNNQWVQLLSSPSVEYINPAIPTLGITVLEQLVRYKLPDVYLLSGQVSGDIRIDLYETQGYLDLPIYKYPMSEYNVSTSTTSTDIVSATIANITVYANSRASVNGGSTGLSFAELKTSVINNALGNTTLPVTIPQLSTVVREQGFDLYKALDMVTQRIFVATKNLARYNSNLITSKPDVFFNTTNLDISNLNTRSVVVSTNYILIPSDTVFKEVNGKIDIITTAELDNIAMLSNVQKISYLQTNKLFYTPYYYAIDITDTAMATVAVYDLDTPSLRNIKITGKNVNVVERVNIDKYGLYKTSNGYELRITIISNTEFQKTNKSDLHGQLTISMYGGHPKIHFEGLYDAVSDTYIFRIDTDFNISPNDTFNITNGHTSITNNFIDLVTTGTIYLYSVSPTISDPQHVMESSIVVPVATTYTVLDKEEITLSFGKRIKYIWNKMFTTYTDKKYLKYTTDQPATYAQDVYKIDPVTGSIVTVTTVNGVKQSSTTLLHAAGTPILDAAGAPTYSHRVGDIILDANNTPTIDPVHGVIRHIDILMLEYEYMLASDTVAVNYRTVVKDTLNNWLFTSMPSINTKVLENTQVLYRSFKKAVPVGISVESLTTYSPYTVKPTVTLYTTKAVYTDLEMSNLVSEIGYLIHQHLDSQLVDLTVLKKEISNGLDSSIISAKIEGVETHRNSEVFSTVDPLTRLTIGKVLTLTENNTLVVNYDLTVKTHKV